MVIHVHKSSRKGPVIHVKFYNETWNFLNRFFRKYANNKFH